MMKALLITDASLGKASAYMAEKAAETAAEKCGLTLTRSPAEAELVVVAGKNAPTDPSLSGKPFWQGDLQALLNDAVAFLTTAREQATPWQAPVNAQPVVAETSGAKRIVAVPPVRPASLIPLWRQKPSRQKLKNVAGGRR